MKLIGVTEANNTIRQTFFQVAFGENEGYIALAGKTRDNRFTESFFKYPDQLPNALEWINRNLSRGNLYFCPNLFSDKPRIKANVINTPTLWSDLDDVDLDEVSPKPSVVLQTSEGRYQALWILSEEIAPYEAEQLSRKLAYANKADTSGWDLTQLLRIPVTYNFKYEVPDDIPIVEILRLDPNLVYKISDFGALEDTPEFKKHDKDLPKDILTAYDPEELLRANRKKLLPHVFDLYEQETDQDWSKALWSLQCLLLEAGLTTEETFVVAWNSAVNKYKRDGRSQEDLWRETLKAKASVDLKTPDEDSMKMESLLTAEEKARVKGLAPTFVERFIEWGKRRSDAAPQYHEAGAFIILSTIIAEGVRLPTSFGNIIPNLWFAILGDTTLTRKTTSMELAIEPLMLANEDCITATDGSMEGLLTALSMRPGRTSLFWRDEFSGFLDAMTKRDYQTGMMEALTKLYDGKYQKRILRKEIIEIRDPIFIMFVGGIKSRILELLNKEHIISGFVPRFVFIIAEPDVEAFRPAGPRTDELKQISTELYNEIAKLSDIYSDTVISFVGDQEVQTKRIYEAHLTEEAWARYNQMERQMVEAGLKSDEPDIYTPMMDRLAKSGLKAAMLLAASRQTPDREVIVELDDILRAASYVDRWKEYAMYVVKNAGKTASEKRISQAFEVIKRGKNSRSELMRSMHLDARETNLILDTLEQRGMIVRSKFHRGERLYPTTGQV